MMPVDHAFWSARRNLPEALTALTLGPVGTVIVMPLDVDEQRAAELFVRMRDDFARRLARKG